MSNKRKRFLFFFLTLLFSFGIPAIVTIIQYDIIEQYLSLPKEVRFSMWSMFIVMILSIIFYRKVRKFLNKMEFSIFKHLMFGAVHFVMLISILFTLIGVNIIIEDVIYIFKWVVGCNIPALFIFEPLWEKYNHLVQREIRVGEIRDGVGKV